MMEIRWDNAVNIRLIIYEDTTSDDFNAVPISIDLGNLGVATIIPPNEMTGMKIMKDVILNRYRLNSGS